MASEGTLHEPINSGSLSTYRGLSVWVGGGEFEMRISRRNVMIGAGGIIAASSTASYARSSSAPSEAPQPDIPVSTSNHSADLAGLLGMVRGALAQSAREKADADV
jgi:hypothetical protein